MRKIIVLFLLTQSIVGFCCTTFVIKSKSNLVFGRNLDWVSENGLIVVNQRNQQKQSIVFPPSKPITWTSNYGSVTFNQFGKEFPFGGMNEKGLVIEVMLANAEYPQEDHRKALNELQWVQYQLDNSSTLDEVIAHDNIIRIQKVSQNLHFLVADQNGNVAVIEFIKGQMVVYKDEKLLFPVLENDSYQTSLQKYQNNEKTRFSMATDKVNHYQESMNISAIDYSFDILKDVALDGSWSIVYDIKNMTIDFTTKSNRKRKTIQLEKFDYACKNVTHAYDMLSKHHEAVINPHFFELTKEVNKDKMQDAMKKNHILMPSRLKKMFYNYHGYIRCK